MNDICNDLLNEIPNTMHYLKRSKSPVRERTGAQHLIFKKRRRSQQRYLLISYVTTIRTIFARFILIGLRFLRVGTKVLGSAYKCKIGLCYAYSVIDQLRKMIQVVLIYEEKISSEFEKEVIYTNHVFWIILPPKNLIDTNIKNNYKLKNTKYRI